METILSFITCKPARLVIWIIILSFFFNQVLFPLIISSSLQLWNLIKHRKFIYIIVNFIIISILISSSSFTSFFTNLFLKLQKTFCDSSKNNSYSNSSLEFNHNDDHDHQYTHKVVDDDHDVRRWFSFSHMDHESTILKSEIETKETTWFQTPEIEKHNNNPNFDEIIDEGTLGRNNDDDNNNWWFFSLPEMDQKTVETKDINCEVETTSFGIVEEEKDSVFVEEEEEEEEGEGDDSLDATWKAIMESKGKESGPHLMKSDTWSAGESRVDESKKEKGGRLMEGLSKYRVTVPLKKWRSFRDMIEKREYFGGGGGGGGGGGDGGGGEKRGWKSVDMALTFQDELKKRADAFIARFTQDIHLQRLESNRRFLEITNRGL